MGLCMADLNKTPCFHSLMKAERRISIKHYRQNKKLKILLFRTPFAHPRSASTSGRAKNQIHIG